MPSTQAFLEIKGLKKEYTPGKPILKGIDINIEEQGIIAIIGPSGTGKSTLLRCINRLVEPSDGEIIFQQQDICKANNKQLRQLRCHLGMVFQEYNLVERLTVIENVLTGRLGYMSAWKAWRRKFNQDDINTAFALLETVGLSEHAQQRADSLSGGQRQRVGIARAVMQDPYMILADEPTSSLDPKTAAEIMELLERFSLEKNIPALVNIHDVSLARRFAKRVIGMSEGKIVYDGHPDNITKDHLTQIYGGES